MSTLQKRKIAAGLERHSDNKPQIKYIDIDFNRQVFERPEPSWTLKVRELGRKALPVSYGLSIMLNLALLATPKWMTRRGYFAIGGEWILIALVGYAAAIVAKKLGGKR